MIEIFELKVIKLNAARKKEVEARSTGMDSSISCL